MHVQARFIAPLMLLGIPSSTAEGHFNILLPEQPAAERGKAVRVFYYWGHPFEHELFNAPKPEGVWVVSPSGKSTDLSGSLETVSIPAATGKSVTAYRLSFVPQERGDFTFV